MMKINLSDVEWADKAFSKAAFALLEAAPEEWRAYALARAMYEIAVQELELEEELEMADAEVKSAAPVEWAARQEALQLRARMDESLNNAAAELAKAAPLEWMAYGVPSKPREEAETALNQAAPDEWLQYRNAQAAARRAEKALRQAQKRLKEAARPEMRTYDDIKRELAQARDRRKALFESIHFEKTIKDLKEAEPDAWETFLEKQFEEDEDGMAAAELELSRKAPEEWKAYQTAQDEVKEELERIRQEEEGGYESI